jgi:hypothetical protein
MPETAPRSNRDSTHATHIDRRRQPQGTIKAVEAALAEINWPVHEVTRQSFSSPAGKWTNESYGYALKCPKHLPVKELWVGYLSHQKAPAGLYAGLNPDMNVDKVLTPREIDYRMADFGKYLLLKQIVPLEKIREMEKKFGSDALKKFYKTTLRKVYPFGATARNFPLGNTKHSVAKKRTR